MSPVALALHAVNRAIASFHPGSMPRLSRGHYRRELLAWLLLPAMLGVVEGGVAGVLVKIAFEGAVRPDLLDLAVAIVTGAPTLSNLSSFLWAGLSHGRNKIRFLVGLQVATAALVATIALAPHSPAGVLMLTTSIVAARICWSGVVTIRTTVWRANYPRSDRATMAGKLATVQALVLSGLGLMVGAAMQFDDDAFRVLYPAAAVVGLAGSRIYSGLRVRGHRALVRDERLAGSSPIALINPVQVWQVLRRDGRFARYMGCMFIFGFGNLMVTAPLVIMLRDRFGMLELQSILIASAIPNLLMPLSIPWWSRLLDRVHVVRFRAGHCWAFVCGTSLYLVATLLMQPWLLYAAAACHGIAFGGGVLSWNLGHHDFAPPHEAGRYMGVHVTLTGLRGLVAPVLAVGLYKLFEAHAPGAGPWVLAVSLALTVSGAIGFNLMARGEWSATPAR